MGQYHYICNLDKHEYLDPSRHGDGVKLMEFGHSASGTLTALTILLAASNGRGGGDFHAEHELIGSWASDRIAIIGDYYEADDLPGWTDLNDTPWADKNKNESYQYWTCISEDVQKLMEEAKEDRESMENYFALEVRGEV